MLASYANILRSIHPLSLPLIWGTGGWSLSQLNSGWSSSHMACLRENKSVYIFQRYLKNHSVLPSVKDLAPFWKAVLHRVLLFNCRVWSPWLVSVEWLKYKTGDFYKTLCFLFLHNLTWTPTIKVGEHPTQRWLILCSAEFPSIISPNAVWLWCVKQLNTIFVS